MQSEFQIQDNLFGEVNGRSPAVFHRNTLIPHQSFIFNFITICICGVLVFVLLSFLIECFYF